MSKVLCKATTTITAKPFPHLTQASEEDAFTYVNRCLAAFAEWIDEPITVEVSLDTEDSPLPSS